MSRRARVHFESAERPCGFCCKLETGQWHVFDRTGTSSCVDEAPPYAFAHARCLTVTELNADPELTELGHESVPLTPTAAVTVPDALQDLHEAQERLAPLRAWTLLGVHVEGDVARYDLTCGLLLDE